MKLNLITTALMTASFATLIYTFPVNDKKDATAYLQKFGYLDDADNKTGAIIGPEVISSALKEFQRFAGIAETGLLDDETISMMKLPRCGVKDRIGKSKSPRKKRYALEGSKWPVTQLTYRITKYPTRVNDRSRVNNAIARGFKVWSDVTELTFREEKGGRADIDISFEIGDHGDGYPLDGPGSTLAHAFFPRYGGDAHFDNEELWTFEETSGINMLQVAAHEFGHSLGLSHSSDKKAVMAPMYTAYQPSFKLHFDDIEAIQYLYGTKNKVPPPVDTPDLCEDAAIDTFIRTQNGHTYLFKGEFYWRYLTNGVAEGYPRKIADDWGGLESNLDASITWSNGKTYFFKGGRYWRFTNQQRDDGYPKLMHEGFPGIPDNLDAAVIWSANGKPYFFKGNQYWRYDEDNNPPVSKDYPMSIREWKGLPTDGIDAAIEWESNRTYFFKGNQYYRYNDKTSEVDTDPPYPLSTAVEWFGCSGNDALQPEEDEPLGPPPDTSNAPDLCRDASIDTITRTRNGRTYLFKGEFYWRYLTNSVAEGYPRKIADDWGGLESNLDASITLSNGKTYFFKEGRYWRFTNRVRDNGYPKLMQEGFPGIPDNLDAAVIWSGNGKPYFFKGNQYWRYDSNNDPPVSNEYPMSIREWKGLPTDGIDAAVQWENNRTYFFRGDIYYRFNDITSEVDTNPSYPRSTAVEWFGC